MTLNAYCPHCKKRLIEVAKPVWYMHGMIVVAKFGSLTQIGCTSCVRKKILVNFTICFFCGWWCLPWGIATPIVLIQNLIMLISPASMHEKRLHETASLLGIDPSCTEEYRNGQITQNEDYQEALLTVISNAIWCDSTMGSGELSKAMEVINRHLPPPKTQDEVTQMLREDRTRHLEVGHFSQEIRDAIYCTATEVIHANDDISYRQMQYLTQLARLLSVSDQLLDSSLQSFYDKHGGRYAKSINPHFKRG